jgi:RHS repeat-associated protein
VRQAVAGQGHIVLTRSYSPFGKLLGEDGDVATSYGFAGEQADPNGLIFLRARYYDVQTGRFISKDPFPGITPFPQSLHPYTYCFNNAVNLTDPSGEIVAALILGMLLSGGIAAVRYLLDNPCTTLAEAIRDPAFQQAVGFGMLTGLVGGAVGGVVAGIAAGAFGGGLVSAILSGAVSGGITSGLVEGGRQLLTSGRIYDPQRLGASMLSGAFLGAVAGAIGWKIQQWWRTRAFASQLADDAAYASQRSAELQDLLPEGTKGRVTMGAGVAKRPDGSRVYLIGTSEKRGYLRLGVEEAIRPDEIIVKGTGHAEQNIVNYARNSNLRIRTVGAGRPICPVCERAILRAGGIPVGPTRSGRVYWFLSE